MSTSAVINRWLNRVYKSIAIFLVMFAVLISGLRLLLPYAHNYRLDLQNYINDTYESNVVIGALQMEWTSSGPSLVAANVSLLQTGGVEIYIEAFDINIDFWQSLRHRQIITKDFTLDGVKILFDKTFIAQNEPDTQQQSMLENISNLFLQQINRFSVANSQVIYRSEVGERIFLLDNLDWLNQGDSHKARGNMIVDGLTSNNLQLNMALHGKTMQEMNGTIYLQANQLNITPWLDRVFAISDEDTHSSINFDAWLTLTNGIANKVQVELGQNQIAWQDNTGIKTVNVNKGTLVLEHASQNNLSVYSSDIEVVSNGTNWQPLSFSINQENQMQHGYVSTVDLAGMQDLLPLFTSNEQLLAFTNNLKVAGQVNDIYFNHHRTEGDLNIKLDYHSIKTGGHQGIPAVEGLSGSVLYTDGRIKFDVAGKAGALDFEDAFIAPIAYHDIALSGLVSFTESGWQLKLPTLKFLSDDIDLSGQLALYANENEPVTMSLLTTINKVAVANAPKFYPVKLMGENLISYLNGSLKSGQIEQALVLVNGPLSEFPYKDPTKGIFVVDAELENAAFKFSPSWPAIQHFDANLNFTNNSMLITGRDGSLSGIDVNGVTAYIENLDTNQLLEVNAKFEQTQPELVSHLMLSSPLDDSVGAVLERLEIGSAINGQFSLDLPLDNVDKAVASGTVIFNDNQLKLQSPEMVFTDVAGVLNFENEKISTTGLQALWRDMPLSFTVVGNQYPLHYQTDIDINADWEDTGWLAQLPDNMTGYGNGNLGWQGKLTLNNFRDKTFDYQLAVSSNLQEIESSLPQPFSKTKGETFNASVVVTGDLDHSIIDAKITDQLAFYGKLDHEKNSFEQAHLIVGREPMFLPINGFYITTQLSNADFFEWQPFISDIFESLEKNQRHRVEQANPLLPSPQRIRGNIAELALGEDKLTNVAFSVRDETSWWLLELTSKEAHTRIQFLPDWLEDGLNIDADFIRLSPQKDVFAQIKQQEGALPDLKEVAQELTETHKALFSSIPPIRFQCNDCRYGKINFGEVNFVLKREQDDQLTLSNFVAKRKNSRLNIDALWRQTGEQDYTQLTGSLRSADVEREVENLGFNSTISDSSLDLNFDIHWANTPFDFELAKLNGDVKAKLDEGVLKDVPSEAKKASALSILSLQSLVRKLKFDFRDIFSEGMFYTDIRGDFHLKDGVIYTQNTYMKGTAGDLTVKGNTDLNSQVLDYRMSFKPNITSSLPAIAWIATLNPVTFLAGIAIDEVITSQVVSEFNFEVTGGISDPLVREVNRKTKNITVGRDKPQVVENNEPEPEAQQQKPQQNGLIPPKTNIPLDLRNES